MGVLTWGQLRMNLQQSAPGISADLVDEFLNTRYARVLDHTTWLALEGTAYVETATPYQSDADTVSVTQGSANIVGSGTSWTSGLTGQRFQTVADGPIYTFTYVDATHATLDRPYEGTTISGVGYRLFTNVYPLPDDFKAPVDVEGAEDGFPLTLLTGDELSTSAGFRDVLGDPAVGVVTSPDGASWQVELFPIPDQAKGYPVRYQRSADAFDGTNTGASPLAFVSDAVLLAGARADMFAHLDDQVKTAFYERKFADELMTMVRADRRARPPRIIHTARRFTRHRIERLMRSSLPRIPN